MFLKVVILMVGSLASSTFAQYTPSSNTYALNVLIPFLNVTNFLFDGPGYVSYAATTPTTNTKPTLAQMMYYNYYCASMYCQYQIADLSCEYCAKFKGDVAQLKVLTNNTMNIAALVTLSEKRKEIVVAFRGSQNIWNVLLDFTMINGCYDDPGCDIKLHLGFYLCTMGLYDQVITNIGYLLSLNPSYKIVLTGHSLGGAMARLTAFFILYSKQFPGKNLELYTYGEPRSGNKGLADFMNAQNITTARVTARADIGPHIIPVSILGTTLLYDYYVHPQTEYWINGTNDQKFADTSRYNDPTLSDSLGPAYSVIDHFQYFDADYLVCWLDQPSVWLTLPGGILPATEVIPALPNVLTKFLGDGISFTMFSLVGLLGR